MLALDLVVPQVPQVGGAPAPGDDPEHAVDDDDALVDAPEDGAEEGVGLQRLVRPFAQLVVHHLELQIVQLPTDVAMAKGESRPRSLRRGARRTVD